MATIPTEQAFGLMRRRVGDVMVTAVNDGQAIGNFDALRGISVPDGEAVLRARFRPPAPTFTFNTFLVQDGARNILVDTGGGGLMGPVAGRLLTNLASAGITPADIDAVLLTHLHIDHVGGLTDATGAAVFPHAHVFVAETEAAFWLDEARASEAPEAARPAFAIARAALAAYPGRVERFTGGEPVPGLHAESLPGHTPGHTGFRIAGPDGGLLIWGDIVHLPDIQSRRPDVTLVFDTDPAQAIATRRRVFEMAARERLLVAGMHMHFPAFSYVVEASEGYDLIPAHWTLAP